MKMRIAAAAALAVTLLLAAHVALAGRATADRPARDVVDGNATHLASVPPAMAKDPPLLEPRRDCTLLTTPVTGAMAIDVPFICIDQPCQIMLWDDAWVGAYGPGLSQAVYYTQISTDGTWIGGPNISLAGMTFSDGSGTNGDGSLDAIFAGGVTSDGNLASLYDDWLTETSPYSWTITFERYTIQEKPPTFYVCPLALDDMYERFDVSSAGAMTVTVPDYCIDGVCGILMWNNAEMYAFGPGMHWPVHYTQSSADGSWIGGPDLGLGGGPIFSEGSGVNGDAISDTVFIGDSTTTGGYVRLHDDSGIETSADQWTIELAPDSTLTEAAYIVYPLFCERHPITVTGATVISMPMGCIGGMCTVLMWNDATMGAFEPGIKWPVYYTQSPTDDTWIGGPNINMAGMSFSQGAGTNGIYAWEDIFLGGWTPSGGYVQLSDDSDDEAYGSESTLWTAVLYPKDDLTEAAYYVCWDSCLKYDVPIRLIKYWVWLPLVQRAYP